MANGAKPWFRRGSRRARVGPASPLATSPKKGTHSRLQISWLCTIGEHSNLTMKPVDREHQRPDWERVAASAGFKDLLAVKKLFIVPAFLFFFAYFFCLLLLTAYAPRLISVRPAGMVTLGYLLALSQFVVGWVIAWLYLRAATRFDSLSRDLLTPSDNKT